MERKKLRGDAMVREGCKVELQQSLVLVGGL